MRFARTLITASLVCVLAPAPAFCAPNNRAIRDQLVALYPLTRVGMTGLAEFDYTRITQPGAILAVRLPGIYADVANTKSGIIETNVSNGQITQAIRRWREHQPFAHTGSERKGLCHPDYRETRRSPDRTAHGRCHNVGRWTGNPLQIRVERQAARSGDHDARGYEEDHRHRNYRSGHSLSRREQDHQAWHEPGRGEEVAWESRQDRRFRGEAGLHLQGHESGVRQ